MATRGNGVEPGQDDADAPSFALGRDGKIEGIYRPQDHRRSWTPTDTARLELSTRPRITPESPPPAAPRPRRSLRSLALPFGIVLAVLTLVPLARRGLQLWNERGTRSTKASGLIVIDSVPSNARLFIEGEEVGRTPYVAPNTFQPGTTISARILYPGAQEWTGTFPGGVDTGFTAELQAQ